MPLRTMQSALSPPQNPVLFRVWATDTTIDEKLKIISFEFEVDEEQRVASYATHQVTEILDKLKVWSLQLACVGLSGFLLVM